MQNCINVHIITQYTHIVHKHKKHTKIYILDKIIKEFPAQVSEQTTLFPILFINTIKLNSPLLKNISCYLFFLQKELMINLMKCGMQVLTDSKNTL